MDGLRAEAQAAGGTAGTDADTVEVLREVTRERDVLLDRSRELEGECGRLDETC